MKSAKIVSVIILFTLIFNNCSLFRKNKAEVFSGTAFTNEDGVVILSEKNFEEHIPILVTDRTTNTAISNIRIDYVSDGEKILAIAYDDSGLYLPSFSEGLISHIALHTGVTVAHAQDMDPKLVIELVQRIRDIQTMQDLKSILVDKFLDVEKWDWLYHDYCLSHADLMKWLLLELDLYSAIILAKFPGASEIESLAFGALVTIAMESIALDTEELFGSFPDPVGVRIYHIPVLIPSITIEYLGSCKNTDTNSSPGAVTNLTVEDSSDSTPSVKKLPLPTATKGTKDLYPTTVFISDLENGNILYYDRDTNYTMSIEPDGDNKMDFGFVERSRGDYNVARNEPIINSEGTLIDFNGVMLTKFQHLGACSSISPSGRLMVFVSEDTGEPHVKGLRHTTGLYLLDLLTGDSKLLSREFSFDAYICSGISWSADDRFLYFSDKLYSELDSTRLNNFKDIWRIDISSLDIVRLSDTIELSEEEIKLSPDGKHISFTRERLLMGGGQTALFIMDTDGNNEKQITDYEIFSNINWSPDSSHIAFECLSDEPFCYDELGFGEYCMDICGMDIHNQQILHLTSGMINGNPIWSPDGNFVAFESNRDKTRCDPPNTNYSRIYCPQVYVMNNDGSSPRKITDGTFGAYLVDWLPKYSTGSKTPSISLFNPPGGFFCPGAPHAINGSSYSYVCSENPVPIYKEPGGEIIEYFQKGDNVSNISGHECFNHLLYIKFRFHSRGDFRDGYVLEADYDNGYYICPNTYKLEQPVSTAITVIEKTPSPATQMNMKTEACSIAPPVQMIVGARGYVCTKSDNLLLRSLPNQSASVLGHLIKGETFYVLDGPHCADSYNWWKINTETGLVGWVAEGGDEIDPYYICPIE